MHIRAGAGAVCTLIPCHVGFTDVGAILFSARPGSIQTSAVQRYKTDMITCVIVFCCLNDAAGKLEMKLLVLVLVLVLHCCRYHFRYSTWRLSPGVAGLGSGASGGIGVVVMVTRTLMHRYTKLSLIIPGLSLEREKIYHSILTEKKRLTNNVYCFYFEMCLPWDNCSPGRTLLCNPRVLVSYTFVHSWVHTPGTLYPPVQFITAGRKSSLSLQLIQLFFE